MAKAVSQNALKRKIFSFLERHSMCVLCTMDDNGYPRGSPMEYWAIMPNIYLVAAEGRKLDNIRRDNRVCIAAYAPYEENFNVMQGVQIFGRARIIKYGEPAYAKEFEHRGYFGIDLRKNPRYTHLIKVVPDFIEYIDSKLAKDVVKTKRIWRHRK
ncbi:MAG: pyridoxamine 5'-phosphate oxidase family protein [Candidatus Burarchaeum sp.]|nr:pyridoxamine 5'-phosphate oxidase family protein [Candidatus Burarchaeum sp.]MDO8340333.1 pyridoxamine 5'-phosphate oxidase family protein [Candidatus Burarchaeum sp.]